MFMGNIQEFDNFIKENQKLAKEINIGSNKLVLEMNEETTKYKISRALQLHLNSCYRGSTANKKNFQQTRAKPVAAL